MTASKLDTPRLILRPLQLTDAEATQRLFPQWEIVRYLAAGVPWPYPSDGALTYYRDVALPSIARGEEWCWTLRLKDHPDELIGAISLFRKQDSNRGFWLGLPWHGKGFMTEAASAVTDFWFDVLGFSILRTAKAVENVSSIRISKKTGMRLVATEERDYVSGRLLSEVWEISGEEWRQLRTEGRGVE